MLAVESNSSVPAAPGRLVRHCQPIGSLLMIAPSASAINATRKFRGSSDRSHRTEIAHVYVYWRDLIDDLEVMLARSQLLVDREPLS